MKWFRAASLLTLLLIGSVVEAQTVRTICNHASCTYTAVSEANIQACANASVGGDSCLLQENTVTDVTLTLPAHAGATPVTIRTGVSATGQILPASQFPAANNRMTPALAASSKLAVLRAKSNNTPAIGTSASIGAGGYWTLKHLEVTGNAYGGEALIRLGSDNNTAGEQDSIARIPTNFVLEQVYVHGHPVIGQFRGIRSHVNNMTLRDSTIKDIKSTNATTNDGQAFWGNSFRSGVSIINNYIEGGSEGILFGGSGGCCHPDITVASAVDASHLTLSGRTDLFAKQWISVFMASTNVEEQVQVVDCGTTVAEAACTSNTIVVAPALSGTPVVGADVDYGLQPADILIEKNNVVKPLAWRNNVVGTPQSVTGQALAVGATGCASGTLTAGTYSYRIVARHPVAVNGMANSAASTELNVTLPATGCVELNWAAVTNATEYRVYGRSAGGQNRYFLATAPTTKVIDTGAAGTTGTIPSASGWYIKNILEFKNAKRVIVRYNVFDGVWADAQDGYAILFTPANTGGGNDSTGLNDVLFENNIVRNAAGAMQLMGRNSGTPGRLERISLKNNLFYNINSTFGASDRTVLVTTYGPQAAFPNNTVSHGPLDALFDHNTFLHTTGNAFLYFDLYKSAPQYAENFVWTNNIAYKLSFGLTGNNSCGQGDAANPQTSQIGCWTQHVTGTKQWKKNVSADVGGSCSTYPNGAAENFCPTGAQLAAMFAPDYSLLASSPYNNAGTDGKDIGADIAAITVGTNVALSGDNTGTTPPPPPPGGGTPDPPVVLSPPDIATAVFADGRAGTPFAVTVSGSCAAGPCTWTSTGLPTGITMTASSSTSATFSGVPVEPAVFAPVVTLKDAQNRSISRTYSSTIDSAPPTSSPDDPDAPVIDGASRPERFNLDEGVHFRRASEPSADGEPVRTGDIWGNVGCTVPQLQFSIVTAPGVIWKTVAYRPELTVTTINTIGPSTYLAAEFLGGLILRDPNGTNRSDVTPTAATIIDAIPCAEVGQVFELDIRNTADAAETITVTPGTGVATSGTMTIAQNNTRRFKVLITNVDTPAVTIYSVGTFVH